MTPWPPPDKVYFIATVDRSMVKIGSSRHPLDRLNFQLTWSPVQLEIIATAPGSYAEEFALHRLFKAHHSHREWFHGSSVILDAAAEIKAIGVIPAKYLSCTDGRLPNRSGGRPKKAHQLRPDLWPEESPRPDREAAA